MSRPMVIEFVVDAANAATAQAMAAAAEKHGYSPSIHANEDGSDIYVCCSISMLATHAGVLAHQDALTTLFQPYGGAICDSWGTLGNAT